MLFRSGSSIGGLTSGTTYYANVINADTFYVYDTKAHAIAGGATGIAMNVALGNGLTATPSPGSIFAYMVVTPAGYTFKVLLAIAASAAVAFAVGWFLLKVDGSGNEDLDAATARKDSLKNG